MTSKRPRALLIANGEPPSKSLWARLSADSPDVFCVDGGANAACSLGVTPIAVFGDFDSVHDEVRCQITCEWRETPDQEYQDLDKAIACLLDDGYANISVAGVLGRQASHTFGNLGPLVKYKDRAAITYHGRWEDLFVLEGRWEWNAPVGRRISLLPVFGPTRVSTRNLLYPLRDEVLQLGVRDGISNETQAGGVVVTASENPVLVCVERTRGAAPLFAPEK